MSEFVAISGGAESGTGLLLALNTSAISHLESLLVKEEPVLRIHMVNGRFISVIEEDMQATLEALGLGELIEYEEAEDEQEVSS